MNDELQDKLIDFIIKNPNIKFQNSQVDERLYNIILERKQTNITTNVKSIKSLNKFINYYIASIMLNYQEHLFLNYAFDVLPVKDYKLFESMFSEIEYETPEIRILRNPNIQFKDNRFYAYNRNVEVELEYDINEPVTYALLDVSPKISSDCWGTIDYECQRPVGAVSVSVPWIIKGKVTLNKATGNYILSNVKFTAEYPVVNSNNYITARYTGLDNSAWIYEGSIIGTRSETTQNKYWDGPPIKRGRVYITTSNRQVISSIKGDWDGFYNNLEFDTLKDLLEKTV